MTDDNDIRQYSVERLKQRRDRGTVAMRKNAPVYPVDPEFWQSARVVLPSPGKADVHLRIDQDVLDWFRAQGKGHLTRMNAVLRSFMEAHTERGR